MASDSLADSTKATPPSRKRQWWLFCFLVISALAMALLNVYAWVERRPLPEGGELEAPKQLSFDGSSDKLRETIFVPTLERPVPKGKSALWCATFPMAWQELEKTVRIKPLEVEGAKDICRELSNAPKAELEPEHYYAAGGFIKDGILERIRAEVPRRFPNAILPDSLDRSDSEAAIGYACLEAAIHFEYFFKHNEEPLSFVDGRGRKTPVHAFGLREKDKRELAKARNQVFELFRDKGQFALDLSENTKPYQIILARVDRGPTLHATLADVNAKIARAKPKHLSEIAVLLVPSMNWRVSHRFEELQKSLVNVPSAWIGEAFQSIQFKMDRKGARVTSTAMVALGADWGGEWEDPTSYLYDRPFLLVMQKRGSSRPFFVMWVENAELLQRH